MNLKKLGIAFSFSHLTLCFYFILSTGNGYMFDTTECAKQIGSFLILLTSLTGISYKFLFSNSKMVYLAYLLFTYTVFRGLKAMFCFQFGANIKSLIFACITIFICLLLICFYLKNRKKFTVFFQNIILFFVPLALITVYNLSISFLSLQKKSSLKSLQLVNSQPKIFWIIFDELDQYLTFENQSRPYFKNLNIFKNESIYATKALQPGSCTNISLPAFTTGLPVTKVILNSPFHLKLILAKGGNVNWKNTPNIFQKAYKSGYNSALIGWYHPYDRIFSADLAYLSLESSYIEEKKINKFNTFLATLTNQIFSFCNYNFDKVFQVFFKESLIPKLLFQIKNFTRDENWYNKLLKDMENVINNDQLNFCFFHLPIPHYPTCYDVKTNTMGNKPPNYYENVFLVDKTFAWLKNKLQKKKLWNKSIVIVTSDHWLRTEKGFIDQYLDQETNEFKKSLTQRKAPYVPFIIKMPHQKNMQKIDREFNSLILHDIVADIMNKKIVTSQDVLNKIVTIHP